MIYTEKFKIPLKDIGKDNKIKNRAVLEILENIACYHSDLVGYGVNNIKETKVTWILLDWKLKVINRPFYIIGNIFEEKVKIPEEFSNTIKYEVIRKDIDINKHMHNLYYLDLAYEALPDEIYNKRPFDYVRITYKKEIKLGEKVNCKYVEQDGKYVIVIKSEDETVIHAIVELQ